MRCIVRSVSAVKKLLLSSTIFQHGNLNSASRSDCFGAMETVLRQSVKRKKLSVQSSHVDGDSANDDGVSLAMHIAGISDVPGIVGA